jgi:tetratricopeptide (TPR) repeat protein
MSNSEKICPQFICPTAMVVLKTLCDAFAVGNKQRKSPGSRIGTGDEGRTARRAFSPDLNKLVPPETRDRVFRDVALAFLDAGVIDDAILRYLDSAKNTPADQQTALLGLLEEWTAAWDGGVRDACDGWPYLSQHLAGFIVARCVAIDLACRVAALAVLVDFSSPESGIKSAPYETWDSLLSRSIDRVPGESQEKKARTLDVETRTLQRWLTGEMVPTVENLKLLAERASADLGERTRLAQRLMFWRARRHIRAVLEPLLTPTLTKQLFDGFERIVKEMVIILRDILNRPEEWNSNAAGVRLALAGIARSGLDCPPTRALFEPLLERVKSDLSMLRWCGELKTLSIQSIPDRLQAAFYLIGNWPEFVRGWKANLSAINLKAVPTPEHYALRLIDPLMTSMVDLAHQGHIPPSVLGVQSLAEHESGDSQVLAKDLMAHGAFSKALPLVLKLLKEKPLDAELNVAAGICFREALNWDLAQQHLRKAIAARRDWDVPWIELGRIFFNRGMPDQAAHEMGKAPQSVKERSSELQRALGKGFLESGQLDSALEAFLTAVRLNPSDGWSWSGAADSAFRLGKQADGRDYARKAHHFGVADAYNRWVKD